MMPVEIAQFTEEIMSRLSSLTPVSIRKFFARLPDPRRRRSRIAHPLLNIVVMGLCGVIAGADTWEEIARFAHMRRDWLAKFLDLCHGIPSHDTFGRVFSALDPVAFQQCLLAWVNALHEVSQGEIIAIDGKAAREAMARASAKGPLCLVSAWATANHVVLGQVAAPAGSSELGALPKLLELLELHGAIVTLDALGCQKEIVGQIVDQGGDYVIAVKGNQGKLLDAVHDAFGQAFDADEGTTFSKREQGHGRHEERVCTVIDVPDDFPDWAQWAGLCSLAMVSREYIDGNGETHTGVRYYISSLTAQRARTIAKAVRSHWCVENQLHWAMDVSFREDNNRAREENAQANLGMLRRAALSLLRNAAGLSGSVNCKRKQAGWDDRILENVLLGRKTEQS
jgi:predicted transposase YbfD/YdcC